MDKKAKLISYIIIISVLSIALLVIYLIFRPKLEPEEQLELCEFNPDSYPRIDSSYIQCSNLEGSLINRWYDPNRDRTIELLSQDVAPTYNSICNQWCNQVEFPDLCVKSSTAYDNCINELKPSNCVASANPVATTGINFIFVIGRGRISCF